MFFDRGNIYGGGFDTSTTSNSFDLGEMRSSIGAGIRFISPFGPLGFAYGIKLDKKSGEEAAELDRKSTRLNSSHKPISYAVFCLKKKIF